MFIEKMQSSSSRLFCTLALIIAFTVVPSSLLFSDSSCHALSSTSKQPPKQHQQPSNSSDKNNNKANKPSSSPKKVKTKRNTFGTIADVMQAALLNPNAFSSSAVAKTNTVSSSANGRREVNANGRFVDIGSKPKGPRRTRKKVDRPRQQYVYAGQRRSTAVGPAVMGTTGGAPRRRQGNNSLVFTENATGDYYYHDHDDHVAGDDDYSNNAVEDKNKSTQKHSFKNNDGVLAASHAHQQQPGLLSQQHLLQQQTKERAARMQYLVSLGLSDPYTSQFADAIVGDGPEEVPHIAETIRLLPDRKMTPTTTNTVGDGHDDDDDIDDDDDDDDDDGGGGIPATATAMMTTATNSHAYILYKPVGWSILGDKKSKRRTSDDDMIENDDVGNAALKHDAIISISNQPQERRRVGNVSTARRVKAYDEQLDDFTFVEYNEEDVLAAMTPSERAELMMEGGFHLDDSLADAVRDILSGTEWDDDAGDNESDASAKKRKKMKREGGIIATSTAQAEESTTLRRSAQKANLEPISRPSLVNWLKEYKASEGTPIKGGKYWIALAGATEIDDSGLVLLCPRDRADAVTVDESSYVAVVGNGKKLTSRSRLLKSIRSAGISVQYASDTSLAKVDILSRLKKWREDDPIATVSVTFPGGISSCNHVVLFCQDQFGDGVRGDAMADPLDRRSPRRLVHCTSLLVSSSSSITSKSDAEMVHSTRLPDDIASYANRRDGSSFLLGDFLGRRNGLGRNTLTTAYREVNGASDGHPGWIVDRYGKWLFVQHHHDEDLGVNSPVASVKGPLPSLHDGYTAGVYYLPTWADRSVMGSERIKPTLLEGQASPEYIPIVENGIQYLINLGDSFSTGIFLDQRLQRAYLAGVCNENTRLLNCFAHTGAFSVAAATAGASTVSLDLEKKWLDRIRPQFEANGIMEWEGRHDCVFGDCFDWLARLAKRGEQFDIVILDPPSTSVGKKKKRWSVKNDMAELVSLAAPLIKSNGLLFTTTNSASLRIEKFGNMCRKGLLDAGVQNPRLERISAMPSDFSSIGQQPVKNLVWRIP